MPFLKWLKMIENGKQQTSTFCSSFILMSRASHSSLVKKSSLALKCQNLKVTHLHFSNILLHKRRKKEMLQLSSSSISRPVKIFWPNLNENPLTSINEWQKVEVCYFPFSIISSHFKNGIYELSLYWGMNTYAYHCSTIVKMS